MCERGADLDEPVRGGLLNKFMVLVVFLSINFKVCDCGQIAPERCLIWGPGLNPDLVLPVRYFIIQAVSSSGENLTVSPGKLSTNTNTSVLQVALKNKEHECIFNVLKVLRKKSEQQELLECLQIRVSRL